MHVEKVFGVLWVLVGRLAAYLAAKKERLFERVRMRLSAVLLDWGNHLALDPAERAARRAARRLAAERRDYDAASARGMPLMVRLVGRWRMFALMRARPVDGYTMRLALARRRAPNGRILELACELERAPERFARKVRPFGRLVPMSRTVRPTRVRWAVTNGPPGKESGIRRTVLLSDLDRALLAYFTDELPRPLGGAPSGERAPLPAAPELAVSGIRRTA